MAPAAERETRHAGNQKEGATRQAGDSDSVGGDMAGRRRGRKATRNVGDSDSRCGDTTAEGCAPRSTPAVESVRRRQTTESRGRRGRQVMPTVEG